MHTYREFLEENYNEEDKLDILCLATAKGRISNKIWRVANLQNFSCAPAQEVDCYMSMNPLVRKNNRICRDKAHVGRLKWLYVDLDYYNSPYRDFSKQQIVGLLEMDYINQSIPQPTYIIDSGRGIYLLWRVDEHINAYSRWAKMQLYLTDKLREFGADRKVASDSARVLRKIGSINSKSGDEVKVLQHCQEQYCLTSLLRDYVISDAPSVKMQNYATHISKVLNISLPDMNNRAAVKLFIKQNKDAANLFFQHQKGQETVRRHRSKIVYLGTEYSLIKGRIKDLETLLLKHRDREGSCREHILFLYRYWQLCITDDLKEALSRTLSLNERMKHPLGEREIVQATASAEKYYNAGKCFRCSNKYVIEALNITPEEMTELFVFVSKTERAKRKKDRNRAHYKERLKKAGRKCKDEQIKERRAQVHKLIRKGYSAEEICKKCNISRATFYADKQMIEGYLACQMNHAESQYKRYQEFCKKMEAQCLKISAFVLNMSFRTCVSVLPRCSRYALSRFLRSSLSSFAALQATCWRSLPGFVAFDLCLQILQC